jgi:ubiquinone/menaquinone biosynthesis C-methylase UbiE
MKLNLGSGNKNRLPDFTNIDIVRGKNIDIRCDVRRLPMIANDSVEMIYASHVLEYFDPIEVKIVLAEWKRILQPKGILRIAVPDFENICVAYYEKVSFTHSSMYSMKSLLGPLYGKMSIGHGKYIYHKTAYDVDSLSELLTECGFGNIRQWDCKTAFPEKYDDWSLSFLPKFKRSPFEKGYRDGLLISLNLEAEKND